MSSAPHDLALSTSSGVGSLYGHVMRLVTDHGMYWTRLAHEHPESRMMHWWMRSMVDPFFRQWNALTSRAVTDADVAALEATIGRLVELRAQAQAFGIPVPSLPGVDPIGIDDTIAVRGVPEPTPALDRLVSLIEASRTEDAQRVTQTYARLMAALDAHERAFMPIRMLVDEIWAPLYTEATAALGAARTIDEYKAAIDRTVQRLVELRAAAKAAGLHIPTMTPFSPFYPVPSRGARGRHVRVAPTAVTGDPMPHRTNLYPKDAEMMSGTIVGHHGSGRGRHARGGRSRRYVGGTELVDLAPVISPAARGVSVKLHLGDDGQLHASICVDGHCYQATSDLSAAIAQTAGPAAANAVVKTSGAIMVGAMLEDHQITMSAGWWSSLKHGVSGVGHTIGHTLKKYKGEIGIAAGLAATAVGGPAAGLIATSLVAAAAGSGSKKAVAQAVVAEAQYQANTNPKVAHALDSAYKSVAKTAAAYHVTSTVDEARAGNAAAQKQVDDLAAAANAGDVSAQKALAIANTATEVAAANGDPMMVSGGLAPIAAFTALASAFVADELRHPNGLGRWAGRVVPAAGIVVQGDACVIPVVDTQCMPTGQFAAWHSTPTQRALYGDQIPSYYNADHGAFLFLAGNRRDLLAYRPTWNVAICDEGMAA